LVIIAFGLFFNLFAKGAPHIYLVNALMPKTCHFFSEKIWIAGVIHRTFIHSSPFNSTLGKHFATDLAKVKSEHEQ
jgi:hypothetical protein